MTSNKSNGGLMIMVHAIVLLVGLGGYGWCGERSSLNIESSYDSLESAVRVEAAAFKDKKEKDKSEQRAAPQIPYKLDLYSTELPQTPIEEVIQAFARKTSEALKARGNFQYRQHVVVEDLIENPVGNVTVEKADCEEEPCSRKYAVRGRFERNTQVIFLPGGKRDESILAPRPPPTLQCFGITKYDIDDLESILPFMLSSADVGKYNIQYVGSEKLSKGKVDTYVFMVWPKKMEKDLRYFEGYVWVAKETHEIVQSHGKAIPDYTGKIENLFPRFTTYMGPQWGKYTGKWYQFPVRTLAKDILDFDRKPCAIREIVKYTEYAESGSVTQVDSDVVRIKPAASQQNPSAPPPSGDPSKEKQ